MSEPVPDDEVMGIEVGCAHLPSVTHQQGGWAAQLGFTVVWEYSD